MSALGGKADIQCLLFESYPFLNLRMPAFGGKADARELPVECPLTAVKRKSVDGPGPNRAGNLRTRLSHDRQSQFSVVSGPRNHQIHTIRNADTGVRNGRDRARDLNQPRAKSQLVEESIFGGFVPPQPTSNGFPQLENGRVLNKSCPRFEPTESGY